MDDSDVDEDENDEYLLQQALASARAVHHIHGVEFDETQEIDVVSDVKFHVANIKLPLGCKCYLLSQCIISCNCYDMVH